MPLFDDHEYPRPQLRRAGWTSLDGQWEFAIDADATWASPSAVLWDKQITVPFAPETPASGVNQSGFFRACWYRRTLDLPGIGVDERLILHFGAVDTTATIWLDGALLGTHEGGYTPFQFDIGDQVRATAGQSVEIVVRAEDDPSDLAKPRGKQDWEVDPHGIWYPRTTGIWQTVWWERIPATAIAKLDWSASIRTWEIGLHARLDGAIRDELSLKVKLEGPATDGSLQERVTLADDTFRVGAGEVNRRIGLIDPGIDDARVRLQWTPDQPTLIKATVSLIDSAGIVIDSVESYTAMRDVEVRQTRFFVNGRPQKLRLVLDQGYWPESGLTAPSPDALRRDVELTKAMGFNGARKHQKIEDPRYLYWADTLGLFVWEELPSAYRFDNRAIDRATRTWIAAIERDRSHPCIITWVPINESWGVPDLPTNQAHRDYIAALYHMTKALDPSRAAVSNEGWEAGPTDIVGIHDYDERPEILVERYGDITQAEAIAWSERFSGRLLTVPGFVPTGQPVMLSEFGGIAFVPQELTGKTWGYSRATDAADFGGRLSRLLEAVRSIDTIAGYCYTQLTDTYQEANGLLYMDRTPKLPLEEIALAIRGPKSHREIEREHRAEIAAQQKQESEATESS